MRNPKPAAAAFPGFKKTACACVCLALLFAGCTTSGPEKAEGHNAAGRPPVPVETVRVVKTDLTESVDVVGALSPKFETEVKSEYSGVVTELYVSEWVRVKKGTPLAKFDTREAAASVEAAKASLLQAEVSSTKGEREYERALKLKASGLITQQNLDDALSAKEAAAAAAAAVRAQLHVTEARLAKAVIEAPMDGVVSYRGVSVGDFVENMGSPKPMFRIVDNRLLDLTFTVPSGKMGKVAVGQPITFTTNAFPDRTFTGRIKYLNPAVDEANRSVKVIAEVRNEPDELRGGLFVEGQIVTGTRSGVLVVPRLALQGWDISKRQAEVFAAEDQTAVRKAVETGMVSGDIVEIVSGLREGEAVVTRGAFNLREGDRLNVKSSEGA
jgi:membrane fusion protein, multidrug efflux system